MELRHGTLSALEGIACSRRPAASSDDLDLSGRDSLRTRASWDVAHVDGAPARVWLSPGTLEWRWLPAGERDSGEWQAVRFAELLAVRRSTQLKGHSDCTGSGARRHALELYTFRRGADRPFEWHPRRVLVEFDGDEGAAGLAAHVEAELSARTGSPRPRRLLVLVNPNAGSGQAGAVYETIARPVFERAGIKLVVRETRRAGHAEQCTRDLSHSAGLSVDGVVAVGGDGVFHEALNGLLAARACAAPARAAELAGLRLAHLPCGSTDALACSLHGTRSVFTAAMHVALGDSLPLDVLRVEVDGRARFACCIATCGFMSDVVRAGDRQRWLGPLRYDLLGAVQLALNVAYRCKVAYRLDPAARALADAGAAACGAACNVCRAAAALRSGGVSGGDVHAGGSGAPSLGTGVPQNSCEERCEVVEGDFMSIMLIVAPCITEKTPHGMARHGHLADGRLKLVLVRRCSPLQYLAFLSTMSASGLVPAQLSYVDVLDATWCEVESLQTGGAPLLFNLDGELVRGRRMAAQVQRGLVRVFARGVERAA